MRRAIRGLVGCLDDCDGWLLLSVLVPCVLGSVFVFGAASFRSEALAGEWGHYYYLVKHLVRLALGFGAMLVLANLDYRVFRNRLVNWSLLGAGLGLVLLPILMYGLGRGTDNRWLNLFGWFPVQPLEMVKFALVLFLARRLTCTRRPGTWEGRGLGLTLLAPAGLVVALALLPNFGNAVVISIVTLIMLFLGGVPLRWLTGLVAPVVAGAVVGVLTVARISTRVGHWWAGLAGEGADYQVRQSLIGLGAGGWHGLGLGAGHQRFWFLPEGHTDFIFSVLGEELGLFGTVGVIVLFTIFALRGLAIADRAGDDFGRLTAQGLTALIILYVVTNIAMTTGLLPVMGVPLPFVSYGGSALVTNLAAVGILLSIDRHGRSYQRWRARWDHV